MKRRSDSGRKAKEARRGKRPNGTRRARGRTPALFSYRNGDSVVHRLPALVKLVLLCVVSVRTFGNSLYGLPPEALPAQVAAGIPWLRAGLYGAVVFAAFFAARTPAASLRKLSFVPVLGVCLALVKLVPATADGFFDYRLDVRGLLDCLLYTFRFLVTATAALVVFETTSRLQIYDALDDVERAATKICPPLKRLRIAQMLSVTISFIPEIFNSWNKIALAARARTPRRPSRRGRLRRSVRILSAEFSALFFNLLQYAENTRRAVANRERRPSR